MPLSEIGVQNADLILDHYLASTLSLRHMTEPELAHWMEEIGADYPDLGTARLSEIEQAKADYSAQLDLLLGIPEMHAVKTCGCGKCGS